MGKSIFGYLEDHSLSDGLTVKRGLARHEEWTEAILPADAEAEAPEGVTDRRPLMVFGAVGVAALLVLVGRLFSLQVIAGDHNLALANGNRIREKVERAPRGMIYDRTGAVLVRNQASFDVTVVPQLLPDDANARVAEYAKVGAMIGMSAADVKTKSEVTCKIPAPECLKNPVPQLVAAGVDRDKALLLDQDSDSVPGFSLDVNPTRQYTDNNLLSAFLGYTGRVDQADLKDNPDYGPTDLIGKLGLEKQYEDVLRGVNGGERTEVDASGNPIRVLASRDPVPGDNLVLSVDQGLQQHLSDALTKQMQASGSKRAAGVAVNPKTGEVLAAVSLPSYDNNKFSQGISQKDYQALVNDPGQPLFNKVIDGGYPSGSTIKPFVAAAALQEGIVTPNTTVDDTGQLDVVNPYNPSIHYIYKGWEYTGLGVVNLFSAIARSSDIYFYTIAGGFTNFTRYLGVEKLTHYYQMFGLGSKTGIDIPNEAKGRVPTPAWKKAFSGQPWYTGDTYNISVGQGDLLVSPLQMAMALSVIANGGTLYKPHLVNQITDQNNKVVQQMQPDAIRKGFVDPDNLALVRKGMWMTVNDPSGTACCLIKAQVPVQVAAKTGTAETVVHDNGSGAANQSKADAWFEAFAPYDNPQIVVVAVVENAGEGAVYAAPAVRETLAWYFTQGAGAKH